MLVFARAMSFATESAAAFDFFRQEVERSRQLAVVPPSPERLDAGDILGRRAKRAKEDAEEPPRNMRRRNHRWKVMAIGLPVAKAECSGTVVSVLSLFY